MAASLFHAGSEGASDFRYEEIQFFFRKHWIRFLNIILGGLFIGLLVLIVLLGFYGLVGLVDLPFLRILFAFTAIVVVAFYINFFILELINYYFDLVIVTDHRILLIRKTVFLKNDSAALDLTKIQDLTVESRGVLRNYLRYGNLIITLSTPTPPLIIQSVPRPHDYLERANRVKREHILKRQEHKLRAPAGGPAEAVEAPEKREQKELNKEYLQDIHELLKERSI